MARHEDLAVTQLTVNKLIASSPTLTGATLGTATAGTISAVHEVVGSLIKTTFTLTGARVPVTDAAGSGSFGTLKLLTLPQSGVSYLGCRQNYTAFAEGAALTGAVGDAVHVLSVGSAALAAAADGTLATTSIDIGGKTASITNSGGTGAATLFTGAGTAIDGTSTAASINLNWSGTAATVDASSTIDVTGTITVVYALLGDD